MKMTSAETYTITLAADGAPPMKMPVHFIDQAADTMTTYRDTYGFGASEMKRGCGEIRDSTNHLIAKISYNGRAWDADGKEIPLHELPPRPVGPAKRLDLS